MVSIPINETGLVNKLTNNEVRSEVDFSLIDFLGRIFATTEQVTVKERYITHQPTGSLAETIFVTRSGQQIVSNSLSTYALLKDLEPGEKISLTYSTLFDYIAFRRSR